MLADSAVLQHSVLDENQELVLQSTKQKFACYAQKRGSRVGASLRNLFSYLVVSTVISPATIFFASSSTSAFSSSLTCCMEPSSP